MSAETIASIIIGFVLGSIASIYVNIATARLIRFYDLQAELYEAVIMLTGSSPNPAISTVVDSSLEQLSRIASRFLFQGHACAMEGVKRLQNSLLAEINSPSTTQVNGDRQQRDNRFQQIQDLHPSWSSILIPCFPPRVRPCECQ